MAQPLHPSPPNVKTKIALDPLRQPRYAWRVRLEDGPHSAQNQRREADAHREARIRGQRQEPRRIDSRPRACPHALSLPNLPHLSLSLSLSCTLVIRSSVLSLSICQVCSSVIAHSPIPSTLQSSNPTNLPNLPSLQIPYPPINPQTHKPTNLQPQQTPITHLSL